MQFPYHCFEFTYNAPVVFIASIALMRGEKVQGHVAPVVSFKRVILMYRQELDRCYSQLLQVRYFVNNPLKGTFVRVRQPRIPIGGKTLYMHLVNNQIMFVSNWFVTLPIKRISFNV